MSGCLWLCFRTLGSVRNLLESCWIGHCAIRPCTFVMKAGFECRIAGLRPFSYCFFAGFLLQNEQSSSCPESSIFARWFIDGPKKSPLSGMLFWKRAVVRDTVYFCDEKPASGAESLAFARSLIAFLRDFHFQVKTLCLSQSDIAFPFEAPDFSRFPTGWMDFFPSEATEISAGRHGILRTGFLCPGDDGLHAPG